MRQLRAFYDNNNSLEFEKTLRESGIGEADPFLGRFLDHYSSRFANSYL